MKPTKKSAAIEKLITALTGKNRVKVIREEKECMGCFAPDLQFKDNDSKREYSISGLCQACQDEIWMGVE